jgi:hypothetical protein
MKKSLILGLAITSTIALFSCKKDREVVSKVVTVSYPTITLSGSKFYSIQVGDPLPTVSATAYDSVLKEVCKVSLDNSTLDNTTPDLYVVPVVSKNSNGYVGSSNVYIAVTPIDDSWDLTGEYKRTSNGALVNVTKVARGIYEVDNTGGAPTLPVIGYFAQTSDSTISYPSQPTDNVGVIDCIGEKLNISATDTSYSWFVDNNFFGTALRVFEKQ